MELGRTVALFFLGEFWVEVGFFDIGVAGLVYLLIFLYRSFGLVINNSKMLGEVE